MAGLPCNLGGVDRLARAVIGAILLLVVLAGGAAGAVAWIAGIAGVVLLGTAAVKFCPLYSAVGLKTCAE